MKFGFNVPVRGPGADREGMHEIARHAELLNYDYIAVTDTSRCRVILTPATPTQKTECFRVGLENI